MPDGLDETQDRVHRLVHGAVSTPDGAQTRYRLGRMRPPGPGDPVKASWRTTTATGGKGKATEDVVLIRLVALTTRDTASRAWADLSKALLVGVPAPVKVVLLLVHDYITFEYCTRDEADRAHRALEASAMQYHNKKAHLLKAVPIRCKPLAIRRRGKAMKEFYSIVEDT